MSAGVTNQQPSQVHTIILGPLVETKYLFSETGNVNAGIAFPCQVKIITLQ